MPTERPAPTVPAKRVHWARHARLFALLYWGGIASLVVGLLLLQFATDAGRGDPWQLRRGVVGLTTLGLLLWNWCHHRYEIGTAELVERGHPYLPFPRRRRLDEIVEVIPCRDRARLVEHHPEAVLVICRAPQRLLIISPRDRPAFLRDLAAADRALLLQDGVVRRPGTEPTWLRAGRGALERRFSFDTDLTVEPREA